MTLDLQRGVTDAELGDVAAALQDAFTGYPVRIEFTADSLRTMFAGDDVVPAACGLARGPGGRVLGVGLAALRGEQGRVAAMGVVREAHRTGVGRVVGQAVLDALGELGARTVVLEALTINTPALALYERDLGFERRRRLIGFQRPAGGDPIEAGAWERALAADGEPDSWQLQRAVGAARKQTDLVSVPAVIPEHHAVAGLLRDAGFTVASIDQYELARTV